jgi:hypothetical protein
MTPAFTLVGTAPEPEGFGVLGELPHAAIPTMRAAARAKAESLRVTGISITFERSYREGLSVRS